MSYKIRVSSRGWSCSPRGAAEISFSGGEYRVPEEMSHDLADRCLRSGRGTMVQNDIKQGAPSNKKLRGAPENKSAT